MSQPRKDKATKDGDELLRRMLNTPPKPQKAKARKPERPKPEKQ